MAVMIEPPKDDEVDDMGVRLARVEVRVDQGFKKVDERFEQVDERFERVEGELLEQRREIKAGFEKIDDRFERLDDRFERMQRTMLWAAVTIIVAMLGSGSAIVAALIG